MNYISSLGQLGLSNKEAETYVAVLKLGVAKASIVAKKTQQRREGTYYILKLLLEKGFMSEIIKSGVKYYSALDPKQLPRLIEEEGQRKLSAINESIEELSSIQRTALTHTKVEFYSGVEGLKSVFSKVLATKDTEILALIGKSAIFILPETYNQQFRRKRKEGNRGPLR